MSALQVAGIRSVAFESLRLVALPSGEIAATLGGGDMAWLGVSPAGRHAWAVRPGGSARLPPTVLTSGEIFFQLDIAHLIGYAPDATWGLVRTGTRLRITHELPGVVTPASPTVLRDGTVVFWATDRALVAACRDGRTRWVMEVAETPETRRYSRMVIAREDGGSFVAFAGALYVVSSTGEVLESHPRVADATGFGLGYSDRCGLGLARRIVVDGEAQYAGVIYLRPPSFEPTMLTAFGAGDSLTSDCGAWVRTPDRSDRIAPDGSVRFSISHPEGESGFREPPMELANGNWLFLYTLRPRVAVYDDAGELVWERELPPEVGELVTNDAYVLTPDGNLYFATNSALESVQQIVSVVIGVGRREPSPSWGSTWANDFAGWY